MSRAVAFLIGVGLDASLGDPPTRFHPVGLVGLAARFLHRGAPSEESAREQYGFAIAGGVPLTGALLATLAGRVVRRIGLPTAVTDGLVLDASSSLRTLLARATEVEAALTSGDLPLARELCSTHLVSRDTSMLSAPEVAGATIESVAENLSDGVIAPWLAFAVGGAPAATAYRIANTMDALWGYRSEEFRALGHGAARLDDILNLLPARLTAVAIVAAAGMRADSDSSDLGRAFATWRADARRTESPNAGHPMAAMAGALGVMLEKRDVYALGSSYSAPQTVDIGRAVRLARHAAFLVAAGIFGTLLVSGV